MKKRIISILLAVCLICSYSATAFAAKSYSDLISGVLDDMSSNNARCEGAPQQSANGAYRLVEMLAIIALSNDTFGIYSDTIQGVLDDMRVELLSEPPKKMTKDLFLVILTSKSSKTFLLL